MPTPEHRSAIGPGEQPFTENLDAHHFYAAYAFASAALRGRDIVALVDHAQRFECPVRYWWASETTHLRGAFDRLIICVHHPSFAQAVEMHGKLRQAAAKHQLTWDDFDAAQLDDYRTHGRLLDDPKKIVAPDGTLLFFMERDAAADALYTLTQADVQLIAKGMLGRTLSKAEMAAVAADLHAVINWMDPIEFTIWTCQQTGGIGPAAQGYALAHEDIPTETSKETLLAEISNKEFLLKHTSVTEWEDDDFTVRTLRDAYEALVDKLLPAEKSDTIENLLARLEAQDQKVSLAMTQKAMDDYGFRPDEQGELFASSQVANNEEGANAFILDLVESWIDCLK